MFHLSYNRKECPQLDIDQTNVLSPIDQEVSTDSQQDFYDVEATEEMSSSFIENVKNRLEEKLKELRQLPV